jgi:uncharacterized protein (TIGR00255 family)
MTGFGEARERLGDVLCRIELRSVNNRHFKLALRCPDGFLQFEAEMERVLRQTISRGSVSLAIRFDRSNNSQAPRINPAAMADYWQQLQKICQELAVAPPEFGTLLALPGVLDDGAFDATTAQQMWPVVERTIRAAALHMGEFRRREGASMSDELRAQCTTIAAQVDHISALSPTVIVEYRDKLLLRVNELVKDLDTRLGPSDVLREVALHADRCDITEEITRLRSHLSQFGKLLDDEASQGRKLDFMCQELFREVNTIGSKSNHVGIAHAAVEAKVCVERMREIVQNVE